MKKMYILLLLVFCLSCTTVKYIEVPVETIKTEYITQFKTDTIIQKDSIDRYIKGDTVYNYKYKYIYKTSIAHDTLIVRDTIPVTIKEEVYREVNKLYDWQKGLMGLGIASMLGIIYFLYRKIKKLI